MLNTAIGQLDQDEMIVSRDVLESLPQSLYRSLPWAAHTIDSCVKIVAEAQRTNNPRRVRAWIDFERNTPSGEDILGSLDTVIHEMTQPGEGFADRVRFANKLRQEALDYLRTSALRTLNVEAGWYAIVAKDEADAVALLRDHDVLVQPGYFYDFERSGHIVLSLLTPSEIFSEGLRRLQL